MLAKVFKGAMIYVTICIATFKRPLSLERLLESISRLKFEKIVDLGLQVVVVDNDVSGSARDIIRKWRKKMPWPLIFDIEPRRGIPFARNRLVELAVDTDFIAFVDDDEVVHDDWLEELLVVQDCYQADIVHGPVLSRFEVRPPEWVLKGGFFDRPRQKTGESIKYFATNNLLIRNSVLIGIEGPFEERLAHTGGSDLCLSLHLSGLPRFGMGYRKRN